MLKAAIRQGLVAVAAVGVVLGSAGAAAAYTAADPTYSTNDANREAGDAHVNLVDATHDSVTLEFVNPRSYVVCFEFRVDDEEPTGEPNFNAAITDGRWRFECLTGERQELTFEAEEFVEVRSVFGAERDVDFDWTRFEVNAPAAADECKQGGFETFGFSNQGRCIASVKANARAGR
jgi:hypothetical protein